MYIVPGSYAQVGFVSSAASVPTGGTTTGFSWYGTVVAYAASASNWELKFNAESTNTTGVWQLMWNDAGTDLSTDPAVVLQSTAPVDA